MKQTREALHHWMCTFGGFTSDLWTHIPTDKYTVNLVGFYKQGTPTGALSEYSFSNVWLWTRKPLGTGSCARNMDMLGTY